MRKISGLIEFIDPQAFDPGYRPSLDNHRADGARLFRSYHDQMQPPEPGKGAAARFNPCILMHRAVGLFRKESPAPCFRFDRAEFLDNPHGRIHIIETST